MKYRGRSIPGANNRRLVAGRGRYAADIRRSGFVWMVLVRSTVAHGAIVSIDKDDALAVPGVLEVLTGNDLPGVINPSPILNNPEGGAARREGKHFRYYPLATDRVYFVGQPVAAVVAEDRYAAHQAAELIAIEYEELPVVTDAHAAVDERSATAIDEWEDNVLYQKQFESGDAATALSGAHGVVRGRVSVQRHLPVPLEPRAYTAEYDRDEGKLTVWSSTQMPHTGRTFLSMILGMEAQDIRVVQTDVGGAFGTKPPGTGEEVLVAHLARVLGRPVRWVEERDEYFMACGHARETTFDFEAGYTAEGRLDGLRIRAVADIGFPAGAWVQAFVTGYCLPAAYKVADCQIDLLAVSTNKCHWAGYRGFGKEVASFAMDRILDRVADASGVDRAEIRLRNFVQPEEFPYSQVSGAMLDSGDYPQAMRKLIDMVDVPAFRAEQRTARDQGRYIGLGFAFELTPEGCSMPNSMVLQGYDGATVRMDPTGMVTVLTGVTSPGSGNETGIAQIVADELGVAIESIRVVQGDTDRCPYGLGNFSSRSLMIGGSAAYQAAQDIRKKLFAVAGRMLEVAPEDLEASDGSISPRGVPSRAVSVSNVASMVYSHAFGAEMEDLEPGLEVTRYFRIGNVYHQPEKQGRFSTYPTWPYMAAAAVVEVDPSTGFVEVQRFKAVHDCGVVVNPLLVDANVHGGIAQGLGGALYENMQYDENGQILTTTFMDYTIPTAVEVPPDIELGHQETPSPATPLGSKGAGESGISTPMGAVASAVEDALGDSSLELMELPLTPSRVWSSLQAAKQKANP